MRARWAITMVFLLGAAEARAADPLPAALEGVGVVEDLGATIPLDLPFVDQDGASVKLGDYFHHDRPVILTLVYYQCPMLCSLVLNGMIEGLRRAGLQAGSNLDLVTVSFDPDEKPPLAAGKRRNYLRALSGAAKPQSGEWPFLTGDLDSIRMLTEKVGFHYNHLPAVKQFAHAAVIFVLTPEGKISRYLYGVSFREQDLRLALAEASVGRFGISFERILLTCFRYDPASRRYHFFIYGFLRIGGLMVFFGLATLLYFCWRFEIRRARRFGRDA